MQPFLMREGHFGSTRRSFHKRNGADQEKQSGGIFGEEAGLREGIIPVSLVPHGIIKVTMFFQDSQKGASHVK